MAKRTPLQGAKRTTPQGGESDPQERKIKEISKEKDDALHKPDYVESYEQSFGPFPMGIFKQQMDDWIDNSEFIEPEAIICEAIKKAKENSPRNPSRYIQSILINFHRSGLFTLDAIRQNDVSIANKSNKKKSVQDFPLERPSSWKEPEPLTEEEYHRMKKLEEEMPF